MGPSGVKKSGAADRRLSSPPDRTGELFLASARYA